MSACGTVLVNEEGGFILTDEGGLIILTPKTTTEPDSSWTQEAAVTFEGWCSDE